MKTNITMRPPASKELEKVLMAVLLGCDECSLHGTPSEATLVVVDEKSFHEVLNERQFFAVISLKEVVDLPANARWIPSANLIPPLEEYIHFTIGQ